MLIESYRLLPQTSCGVCGESTCFNFALKLVAGGAELLRCRPLYEEVGQEPRRRQLQDRLASKWPAP